jgi:hypothetical protein
MLVICDADWEGTLQLRERTVTSGEGHDFMIMIMLLMYLHIMIFGSDMKINAITQIFGNTFLFTKCVGNFSACMSRNVASNSAFQYMYCPL